MKMSKKFGVKTLLGLTAVAAVGLAFLSPKIDESREYRRYREAREDAIEQFVAIDHPRDDENYERRMFSEAFEHQNKIVSYYKDRATGRDGNIIPHRELTQMHINFISDYKEFREARQEAIDKYAEDKDNDGKISYWEGQSIDFKVHSKNNIYTNYGWTHTHNWSRFFDGSVPEPVPYKELTEMYKDYKPEK